MKIVFFFCLMMLAHVLGPFLLSNKSPSQGTYNQLVSASIFPPFQIIFAPPSTVVNVHQQKLHYFVEGTHKPVFMFFFSNWCGHSFKFQKEFLEFGKRYGDIVEVGAVCNDYQPEIAGMFSVTSTPTILFWGMGEKDLMNPEVYNGHRTGSALWTFLTSRVYKSSSRVEKVQTAEEVRNRVQSSPHSLGVVFFSSRVQPQPLMSVMSLAPNVTHIPFIFVDGEHSEEVGKAFNVPSIPSVAVMSIEKEFGEIQVEPYLEPLVTYHGLMAFIRDKLESNKKGYNQFVQSARPSMR